MTKEMMLHNIIVHVARTWERVRVEQPQEEMDYDNIESVDEIISISYKILDDEIIQKIMIDEDFDWSETKEGFSDTYIENLAEKIIEEEYL